MTDSPRPPKCPVCATITYQQAKESEGLVVAGVEAMLEAMTGGEDREQIQFVFDQLGPLEAHCAISLYTMLLLDMCEAFDQDPKAVVAQHRKLVNEALSKAS